MSIVIIGGFLEIIQSNDPDWLSICLQVDIGVRVWQFYLHCDGIAYKISLFLFESKRVSQFEHFKINHGETVDRIGAAS